MMKTKIYLLLSFFMCCTWAMGQTRTVSGSVTDSLGNGLPGVTVTARNSSARTSSDQNGNFKITASGNETLRFSSIGFEAMEVPVGNSTDLKVTLRSQSNN